MSKVNWEQLHSYPASVMVAVGVAGVCVSFGPALVLVAAMVSVNTGMEADVDMDASTLPSTSTSRDMDSPSMVAPCSSGVIETQVPIRYLFFQKKRKHEAL